MHAGRQFVGRPCVKKSSNPRLWRDRRRIRVRSYGFFAVDVANQTHFLRRASCRAWREPHRQRLKRFPIETRRPRVRPLARCRGSSASVTGEKPLKHLNEPAKARTRFGKTAVL
jgi:hypothetical protein